MSLLKTIESMPKSLFTNHHRSMPLAKWATLLLGSLILFFLLSSTNNKSLFLLLNGHLSDWFGPSFWGIITCMGDGLFLFPLGMLLVWKNPKKQQAMIISMILAALALNASKHVIDAPRPLKELGSNLVTVVGPQVKNYSMPSGHTGTVFILAGLAIIFSNRKVALAATALAILTGLSRIAVGAHWPADIIAGAWVGLICSVFGV
ncbi:MAG: phosphatase PAP2 family protein, partial [Endozoicomonas sp. (ex Botrylloides leachii)]|nr:phosphatase PAP2 family protein [Endozoicomonas sp. (ex Botrylloides leachii)]